MPGPLIVLFSFVATSLALAAPPAQVLAVVIFLVAAVLAGIQRSWVLCLIAAGLAVANWPW